MQERGGADRGGGPSDNLKPSGWSDRLREKRDEGQLDRIMAELDAAMLGLDSVVRQAGGRERKEE